MVETKNVKMEEKSSLIQTIPEKFIYKKEQVALVKLDDYKQENVKKALNSLITLLGVKDYFKGKTVLLKPNVLSGGKNVHTPPEILEVVIQFLKTEGGVKKIIVGDSTLTSTITERSLRSSRIMEMYSINTTEKLSKTPLISRFL